jgi:hypothetical protein
MKRLVSKVVKGSEESEIQYPCLVEARTGSVFLMTGPTTGTRVKGKPLGVHRIDWNISMTPFTGTLELSHEEKD